jgi:hypothetical protein
MLVTLTAAATEFRSYPALWRRVTSGVLPAVRRGGRWYVAIRDVRDLARREQRERTR